MIFSSCTFIKKNMLFFGFASEFLARSRTQLAGAKSYPAVSQSARATPATHPQNPGAGVLRTRRTAGAGRRPGCKTKTTHDPDAYGGVTPRNRGRAGAPVGDLLYLGRACDFAEAQPMKISDAAKPFENE